MANYFTLDGVASTTFNVFVAKSNMFDAPAENIESFQIPGSNRILHISSKTFKPFTLSVECYIPRNMQQYVDDFRNFLFAVGKSVTYSEALRPDEYRIVSFVNAFEVKASDKQGAAFVLEFEARPERFLTSGDQVETLTADGSITNDTLFNSRPLLKVYGTGTVTIGDYTFSISSADEYTVLDCDTLQCYKGTTNCNNNVVIDEFPHLVPGDNAVTLDGVTRIEITPRWWIL